MAKDKKSFVLYCDLKSTVDKLTDEEAGKLFKHVLDYVNDLDPQAPDRITEISFEPIKQQLKRDLKKYENIVERNRENGKKGGRPKKPTGLFGNPKKPKKADNDNGSDNDNVNDIPTLEEFTAHALSKNSNLCRDSIRLKYESWVENGWKNGNDKPIKNWKSSLTNTIPYIKTINNQNIIHKPHNLKDLYE